MSKVSQETSLEKLLSERFSENIYKSLSHKKEKCLHISPEMKVMSKKLKNISKILEKEESVLDRYNLPILLTGILGLILYSLLETKALDPFDTRISEFNKGYKLVEKLGYVKGKPIGKNGGIIEPIRVDTDFIQITQGLGSKDGKKKDHPPDYYNISKNFVLSK